MQRSAESVLAFTAKYLGSNDTKLNSLNVVGHKICSLPVALAPLTLDADKPRCVLHSQSNAISISHGDCLIGSNKKLVLGALIISVVSFFSSSCVVLAIEFRVYTQDTRSPFTLNYLKLSQN